MNILAITPIIVPIHHGHAPKDPDILLAMYIVINVICTVWLLIRFFVADHESELDYGKKPTFLNKMFLGIIGVNFPTLFLIIINGFALFLFLVVLVTIWIKSL